MKRRSSSRDSPPIRTKRSHSSIGRYDDSSDERITPERSRRRSRVRTPPSPRRYSPPHRSEYRSREGKSYPSYKVLCVSGLHPKASDDVIKDTLYREYRKFGDLSIRLSHDLDERVAYVCFRSSEDARDAKRTKPRIILFDKIAVVEPVESRSRESEYRTRSLPRSRSISPEPDPYYRSPEYRAPDRAYDRIDRIYGPPPLAPYRDYRHDVPPLPPHHDYMRGPPMHHAMPPHMPPVPPHHYGPPQHMMHHRFRPPPPHFEKQESKKDKFPNYLQHIPPEDDPLATRTLFAGNLEINISDEELRRIFGRYGVVEDIDIKRPLPGTGNAYAFVRYQNLDMAHRSKVELSGQYIGKFQCKIGYGKPNPTTRIWVGGLGPWTSLSQLEREFDRFGAIKAIEYVKGDNQAYILYDSIDAATAALKEMRGFPLGGPDKKLRVDFAGPKTYGTNASNKKHNPPPPPEPEGSSEEFRSRDNYSTPYDTHYDGNWTEGELGYRGGSRGRGGWSERRGRGGYRSYDEEWSGRREDYDRYKRSPDGSPRDNGVLAGARSLSDVAKQCSTVWSGALVLKNSLFPARFHLTDGDVDIIDNLMKDEEGKPVLRITQRLRLDPPKLDDVSKRISASAHATFLGLPDATSTPTTDAGVQTRPLRNLVTYLKQKEAAGVISLINKDTEVTGVLYAFPPCQFSSDLLKRTAHDLTSDALKEDHLVIVVVRGGTA